MFSTLTQEMLKFCPDISKRGHLRLLHTQQCSDAMTDGSVDRGAGTQPIPGPSSSPCS